MNGLLSMNYETNAASRSATNQFTDAFTHEINKINFILISWSEWLVVNGG
jgi:hypothetical protein